MASWLRLMPSMAIEERRRSVRAPCDLDALLHLGPEASPAQIVNLSRSGMLFASPVSGSPGQAISISLKFPWVFHGITLSGVLVHHRKLGTGGFAWGIRFRSEEHTSELQS